MASPIVWCCTPTADGSVSASRAPTCRTCTGYGSCKSTKPSRSTVIAKGSWDDDWTAQAQHAVGDYDIATHNSLVGLQIGADMTFRQCRWAWGIESKLGPYINFANQTSYINAAHSGWHGPHPAYDQRLVANRYQAALIGEVGFQATYKFRPNLMGRASYDFMWITGVALAPEQLQFAANPVNRINTNGTIFAQGVSLGLEWMW